MKCLVSVVLLSIYPVDRASEHLLVLRQTPELHPALAVPASLDSAVVLTGDLEKEGLCVSIN